MMIIPYVLLSGTISCKICNTGRSFFYACCFLFCLGLFQFLQNISSDVCVCVYSASVFPASFFIRMFIFWVFVFFLIFLPVWRWRFEACRHPQAVPPICPSQETPSLKDKLLPFLPSPAASRQASLPGVSTPTPTQTSFLFVEGKAHVFLLKCEAWRCCMVYLPRCDSPKSEAGSFTSDSALDRSHDGGEFLMWWNEDVWLHWLAARSLHSSLSLSSETLPAKVWLFFFFFFKLRLSFADVDLDAVVLSTEKLNHPTASRPRVTDRRPRSQIIAPVSLNWSAGCHGSRVNVLMPCVVCPLLCSPSWPAWTWTRPPAKTKEKKNHSLSPELRRPRWGKESQLGP